MIILDSFHGKNNNHGWDGAGMDLTYSMYIL